jgi:hypothetical protein
MTLKRPGGEKFNIEGTLFDEAKMKMIIDGYTGTRCIRDLLCSFLSPLLGTSDSVVRSATIFGRGRILPSFVPFCASALLDLQCAAEKKKRP